MIGYLKALPIDSEYKGCPIGKGSFPPDVEYNSIGSIGRFCSINGSLKVHRNHSLSMTTTSDTGIRQLLLPEGLALFDDMSEQFKANKVVIGNDVWIGANVFINASKVKTIGDGAIIGTNSLVLHDVPPYSVVYGSPARVQRYRFTPEQIETLLRVRWWDWDDETINKNLDLLIYPEKFFERFKDAEGEVLS